MINQINPFTIGKFADDIVTPSGENECATKIYQYALDERIKLRDILRILEQ